MWVSILYKSCNKESEFDDFQETVTNQDDEVPSLSDEYEKEPFFADNAENDTKAEKSTPIDYNKLDEKIEKTTNSNTSVNNNANRNTTTRVTDSGVSGGKYLVIAGSYLLESNADEMVSKLKNIGYSNAEKVIFDQSQFHSVCAGRFDDYTKAVQSKSELSRRGIDNYIHTKK